MVTIILIAIIAAIGAAGYWYYRSRRVGSTTVRTSAPSAAGWHGDPTGRNESRYWDGAAWTTRVRSGDVTTPDPL